MAGANEFRTNSGKRTIFNKLHPGLVTVNYNLWNNYLKIKHTIIVLKATKTNSMFDNFI